MLTVYKTLDDTLRKTSWEPPAKGIWLKAVNPTPEEISIMSASARVPEHFFRFATEEDESPRIVLGAQCILAIIHVPVARGEDRVVESNIWPDYLNDRTLTRRSNVSQ